MNPNGARAPKETLDLSVPSLFVEFRIVTSLTPNLKGRDKLALRPSHQTQEAARLLGLQLVLLQATGEREIEEAVASLIQQGAAALIVSGDAMFYGRRAQIAELALRYKIPTSCPYRELTRRRLSNELRSQCIGDFPSDWQLRRACP
jgi:hypothetical protein